MTVEQLQEQESYLVKTKNGGVLEEFKILANTGTFVKVKKLDNSEFWIEKAEFPSYYAIIEKVQNKKQHHLNS